MVCIIPLLVSTLPLLYSTVVATASERTTARREPKTIVHVSAAGDTVRSTMSRSSSTKTAATSRREGKRRDPFTQLSTTPTSIPTTSQPFSRRESVGASVTQHFFWPRRRTPSPTQKPSNEASEADGTDEIVTLTANEVDFFKISEDIYLNGMTVDGLDQCWERNPSFEVPDNVFGGKDHVAIYTCTCERCRNQCALAFSGSNDLIDWVNNLKVIRTSFCGIDGIHNGFVNEFEGVYKHSFWSNSVMPLLQSSECSTLNAVGHSLGGAVASIFAACINCPTCEKPEELQGINQEVMLWTMGAPEVADPGLTNGRASDGAFKGKRFWNFHDRDYWLWKSKDVDIVSSAPAVVGYKHPKMEAIGLDMDGKKDIDTPASDAQDTTIPFGLPFRWDIGYHMSSNYSQNARNHIGKEVPSPTPTPTTTLTLTPTSTPIEADIDGENIDGDAKEQQKNNGDKRKKKRGKGRNKKGGKETEPSEE